MNESLLYFARHNAWASKTLLEVCRTLTPDQLDTPLDYESIAAAGSFFGSAAAFAR